MAHDVLAGLLQHQKWSNLTIIDFLATLNDDQLALCVPGTFSNPLHTMKHIVANDAFYLKFFDGRDQVERIDQRSPEKNWNELRAQSEAASDALIRFVSTLEGDPIQSGIEDEDNDAAYTWPTSLILAQIINHGTEHRSHIRTILSTHGITPPEIDGWAWEDELKKEEHRSGASMP